MSEFQPFQLKPLAESLVPQAVHQLASQLKFTARSYYQIEKPKDMFRPEPPLLLRDGADNCLKIRFFSDKKAAEAYQNFLAGGVWAHGAHILGRSDRAVAEAWIEGCALTTRTIDEDVLRQAGTALGRLHRARCKYTENAPQWIGLEGYVRRTLDRLDRLMDNASISRAVRDRLQETVYRFAPDVSEQGLAHGDYAPENLLVDGEGRLIAIDNETLRIAPLDYDLARVWWRWPMSAPGRRAFLDAYAVHRDAAETARHLPFWLVMVLTARAVLDVKEQGAVPRRIHAALRHVARNTWPGICSRDVSAPVRVERRLYQFCGVRIDAASFDGSLLAWLDEFLLPQFAGDPAAKSGTGPVWSLEIKVGSAGYFECERMSDPASCREVPAFIRDGGWITVRDCGSRGAEHIFFDEIHGIYFGVDAGRRRVRIYARRDNRLARGAAMRATRELGMRHMWNRGGQLLHAAGFANGGNGCLIAGPKKAGKTTLLTYLLASGRVSYVTNDRAALTGEDGGYRFDGIPTIVSLRYSTTGFFPILREGQARYGYKYIKSIREARERGRPASAVSQVMHSPDLSPAQYLAHLEAPSVAGARLAAILVPVIRTDAETVAPAHFRITRLHDSTVRKRLPDALFQWGDAAPGGELLPLDGVDAAAGERRGELVEALVHSIPWFGVEFHANAFKDYALADALGALTGPQRAE